MTKKKKSKISHIRCETNRVKKKTKLKFPCKFSDWYLIYSGCEQNLITTCLLLFHLIIYRKTSAGSTSHTIACTFFIQNNIKTYGNSFRNFESKLRKRVENV